MYKLVHTLTEPEPGIYFKTFVKKTIFNEHPVYDLSVLQTSCFILPDLLQIPIPCSRVL